MRFTHPAYLLLLVLVAAGLILSFRHVHGMMLLRKRLAFAIRGLLLCSVVLALAGPEAMRPNHGTCTIFVLDRSDSISDQDYARARSFIEGALKKLRPDDYAGLVVFGREPAVERTPGPWRTVGPIQSVIQASATDIGAAIRLACASFPEGKSRRIVLLSDGNETNGDAAGAALAAAADGVTIDHVTLGLDPREGEVAVLSTDMPTEIGEDQPFDVRVVVDASRQTSGTLVLDRDGRIVKKEQIRLNAGRNALLVQQSVSDPGFHRYRATITAAGDRDTRNNVGAGFVSVRGRPKVLILQQDAKPGPLVDALRKQGLVVEVYGPEGVPSRPEQLQAYDAVVYNDINADSMTPFQMKLMQAAAKDSGLGFAMIGGENSFLPGGYFGTPIADILPVDLNIKRRESFPSTSVCIVCDTSGSMGIPEDGIPKVRLAAKAAEEAVLMMSPLDRCGVAGSTDTIEFVAPMQRVTDKEAMIRQIRTMTAGGGGIYVRPSLEFGRKALEREDSKVRHMILMADGTDCDTREGCEELAAQMRSEKITVSTIAMGAGQYVPFLKRVAAAGGGRFFLAQKASELPAVFTQDTAVMSRSAIQDGAFLPKAAMGEDALKGIDPATIPPLFAYCLSDSRSLADVGMKTNHDDPLLATWQYGLANTLAFTSDAQPRWAARWVNWESFGMFWAQAIRSITRRATLNAYEVSTSEEGGKGVVQVKAVDAAGNPLKRFAAEVRVSSPTGRSMTVPVSQKAPGVFRGQFDADEIGSYIVTVAEDDPAGGKRVDATGLSIPYPPEYRDFRANEPLLDQVSKASGGMSLLHPEDAARPVAEPGHSIQELWQLLVFLAAVLLPLDVGARRVAVPVGEAWQKAVAWWRAARLKQSRPHPQTIVVERLQRAKRPAASESKPAPEPVVIEQAERPQSAPPSAATSTGSAASKLLEAKRKRQG